jgi:hypothetical protein
LKAEVVVLVIKEPKELKYKGHAMSDVNAYIYTRRDQLVNRDLLVKLDHQEIRYNSYISYS